MASMTDVVLGIAAPLAVAAVSWAVMSRTYRRDPQALTTLMIAAFGLKLVVFGVYMALALKVFSARPVPFIASFVGAFIVLHAIEAYGLSRLFSGRVHESR
jgi:hypothetical protein